MVIVNINIIKYGHPLSNQKRFLIQPSVLLKSFSILALVLLPVEIYALILCVMLSKGFVGNSI